MNESYHTYTHTHIHANAHTHTHTHSYQTYQTHGSNRSKSHITHEWLEWSQYYPASNLIERQSCLRISLLFAQCISTVVFACHVHNLVHGPTHIFLSSYEESVANDTHIHTRVHATTPQSFKHMGQHAQKEGGR